MIPTLAPRGHLQTITLYYEDGREVHTQELNDLRISDSRPLEVLPGGSLHLKIMAWDPDIIPPFLRPIRAKVDWSVQPKKGVKLHPKSGEFTVDSTAQAGTVYTVTAIVEKGLRTVRQKIYVYTPTANPLVGYWAEERDGIRELEFRADSTFSVTLFPFEVYQDYWGRYTYDLKDGRLILRVDGGNHVPNDIVPAGRFELNSAGELILEGIYFGTFRKDRKSNRTPDSSRSYTFIRIPRLR